MGKLIQTSKVKISKEPGKSKIKRAEIEGFSGAVRMGIHGGIAQYFKLSPEEPMASTLDYIVAAVGGCMTGTVAGALEARGVSVRIDLPSGLPRALGDRVQLQQVLLNLIMNGADAMSLVASGTRILGLSSRVESSDDILVSIEDSGTGLEDMEIIRQVRADGATVLMVEQNAYAALDMCDRAYLYESGSLALEGTGKDLIDDPHVRKAYLGA